ncbi:MAG TPA: mannose-1-phosphate guanylyltransferase [Candidatus Treponema faecavium]|nr:mannose-1-phosphate guanylyltransferase [Candidatus Treponema faecavium]
MFTDVLILAGGFGERLWPASSAACPKQFMSLQDGMSFFQAAVLRAAALGVSGRIIAVTRKDILHTAAEHCQKLIEQLPEHDGECLRQKLCVIAEPCQRHTAPPVMLALRFLERMQPSQPHSLFVCTSDHVIHPESAFTEAVQAAFVQADAGKFVCFGIPPVSASSEYGYIKHGGRAEHTEAEAYTIDFFKEKPDARTAAEYLADGHYWWNSGMFGFGGALFENELARLSPAVYDAFPLAQECSFPLVVQDCGIDTVPVWDSMEDAYLQTPAVSIDKAIAEKTDKAVAIQAPFFWDDVGSWDSFERLFSENSARTVQVESSNCFVYADVPVVLCGVDDLIVAVKNGKVLIVKKGKSALVREAVRQVKAFDCADCDNCGLCR